MWKFHVLSKNDFSWNCGPDWKWVEPNFKHLGIMKILQILHNYNVS